MWCQWADLPQTIWLEVLTCQVLSKPVLLESCAKNFMEFKVRCANTQTHTRAHTHTLAHTQAYTYTHSLFAWNWWFHVCGLRPTFPYLPYGAPNVIGRAALLAPSTFAVPAPMCPAFVSQVREYHDNCDLL